MNMLRPTRFDYDEPARALLVEWSDGATHRIGFADLRRACPCAGCKGEAGFAGRFATQPLLLAGEDELADISLVGAYGLNAVWADGHSTGIYTYERLRELGEAAGTTG
jgi:prepilin-type processing-associated H-X9-DG protein